MHKKKIISVKKAFLPSAGLQTECLHGLVTGLECHIHSVHELPGFWYLPKIKITMNRVFHLSLHLSHTTLKLK